MKSFKDLCLDCSEEEYRALPYYSFSQIAKYDREGVKSLTMEEKPAYSPSMLFGSIVDCLITDMDNFNDKYAVVHFNISDTIRPMIDWLINNRTPEMNIDELDKLPNAILKRAIDEFNFGGSNWKDETKISKLIEGGKNYYQCCIRNKDKTVISQSLFEEAMTLCKEITQGKWSKSIFDFKNYDSIEFLYQQKLVAKYGKDKIKGMIDLLVIDRNNKLIKPYDIKTTSSSLRDFKESFFKWRYNYQQSIYWWLILENIKKDDYFKNFSIQSPIFIVASRYEKKVCLFKEDFFMLIDTECNKWQKLLDEMIWLNDNKYFDYEYEVYANNGLIKLKDEK